MKDTAAKFQNAIEQHRLLRLEKAMTGVTPEQVTLAMVELKYAWSITTSGAWGKGATTHETISVQDKGNGYHIANWRHSNDANFAEMSKKHVPHLLFEVERLRARVAELELSIQSAQPKPSST